ncbi:GNAT family N-acetyltransferase [Streptomyces syringium]|uniref:GNAT family N-acetyltransferase n=1 Tax=Streptomyces syringium TaxID=76729 RepID=UPI00365F7018
MSFSFSLTGTDLTTERLVLRQWSTDELSAVLDDRRLLHWAEDFPAEGDRGIAGFISEHPECLRETYGQRQIVERGTGLVVGAIGLFWPPTDRAVEIGYGIVPSRRGRGYATEATRALAGFVLAAPGVDTVYANVELSNPASGRVLEKAGLRRVGGDAETARYVVTAADPVAL